MIVQNKDVRIRGRNIVRTENLRIRKEIKKNGITLVRMNTDLFINDSYIRTTLSEAIEKATLKLESTIERATTNG